MKNKTLLTLAALCPLSASLAASDKSPEVVRPNILFISVDDLRCSIGTYGDNVAKTPSLDKLASESARFDRHYVNFPICIPSRVALLTGARPERTRQGYGPHIWPKIEGIQPMGTFFTSQGYWTASLGKIWHWYEGSQDERFDKFDWNYYPPGGNNFAVLPENRKSESRKAVAFERGEAPEADYPDAMITDAAIAKLDELSKDPSKPFLLMVGYLKPHLPFNAPAKYWDLYDPSKLPKPANPRFPVGAPDYAHNDYNDLAGYRDIPKAPEPLDRNLAENLVHGYYACVSFIDAQIGRLLEALENSGLADNTIVVLWSDHGWHLGDQSLWSKNTNFEITARSPLIIRAPGVTRPGSVPNAIAESVDIFPTLVELCGIKPPAILDGDSLVPVLRDPGASLPEQAAYHVVVRWVEAPGKPWKLPIVGRAVRNDRFRLVEWHKGWEDGGVVARELYDYDTDPDEKRNLADDPAYKATRDELSEKIAAMQQRFLSPQ
ncbi:MAG: sulfatase [Terrimicrobiaceae bacterium]